MNVHFSPHLRLRLPLPEQCEVEPMPETVSELVNILEERFPRLKSYLVHENGTLRQHVQIYLDEAFIRDRAGLSDPLAGVTSVHVMQALSGG